MTGFKHGNRPSLTAQSFKTTVLVFFFFFYLTWTTLNSLSSLLFCSLAARSLVINSHLNSIFPLCFNLPKGAGESGKSTIVKQMK